MHRTLAPLALILALALCLLPASALAGKNKSKKGKKKGAARVEAPVEDRDKKGLGSGGVPSLRDDVRLLEKQLDQLEREFDRAKYATREALRELDATDEATQGALERIVAALRSLDSRVGSLEDTVGELDVRVAALEELANDDDLDGLSENLGDCDDANPDVNPMMFEVPGNDIDDDCDFQIDEPEDEPGLPLEP